MKKMIAVSVVTLIALLGVASASAEEFTPACIAASFF